MPTPQAQQVLSNVPSIPFIPNPPQFDAMTQRNHHVQIPQVADPGDGQLTQALQIAQAGIVSGIWLNFRATLTVTLNGGTATTRAIWPYGLLRTADFSANFQNQVIFAKGTDLHVHRFVMNPALPATGVDAFAGTVGGGNALSGGATDVNLTWYLPIAADKTTLIGSIYAQSASNLLTLQLARESIANLIALAGGATATLTDGRFSVAVDFFDIPRDPGNAGAVVTPDLRRVHGLNFYDIPFANTGQIKAPLIPVNGNLLRLFVGIQSPTGNFSPRPAANSGWTEVDLHYGANKSPQQWDLNSLVNRNVEQYGGVVPYNYVVLDFMRENPVRDAVVMNGVTDLAALLNITPGTSIPANSVVHIVQETLYS